MKRLLSLVFLLTILLVTSVGFAQDPGTGTPAFDSFSHAGGGIDTINLGNLNVHMEIPLRSLGAYGPKAYANLEMDSYGFSSTPNGIISSLPFTLNSNSSVHALRSVHRLGRTCADYEWRTPGGVMDGRNTYHPAP